MTRDARHDHFHKDVTHSQAELDAMLAEARKAGADQVHMQKLFCADRIAFIREAAIACFMDDVDKIRQKRNIDAAWSAAKALWDAKPEDC